MKQYEIEDLGGGWFELPNGDRVQGKDKAKEKLIDMLSDDRETPRWEVSFWNEYVNFECGFCSYTTLDFEQMTDHFNQSHTQKNPQRRHSETIDVVTSRNWRSS